MNQTRANYQQFINDIYTSQKHILGLVTKLAQRMDDLEARLRAIKDDQNLHLSAVKNSLDELRGEIRHQYTEEAGEIDELNDVLAGEIENLDMMTTVLDFGSVDKVGATTINVTSSGVSRDQVRDHETALYEGRVTDLESLVTPDGDSVANNISRYTNSGDALIL